MLTPEKNHSHHNPVRTAHTLSRNNMEFAGLVVYFFALAIIFVITIIVLLCQPLSNEKAAQDHQPGWMAGFSDPS